MKRLPQLGKVHKDFLENIVLSKLNLKLGEIQNKYHLSLYKFWLVIFIPGFFLGILSQFQINLVKFQGLILIKLLM